MQGRLRDEVSTSVNMTGSFRSPGSIPIPHAHDGLAAGVELPGKRGDAGAGRKEFENRLALLAGKTVRPSRMPALGHGAAKARLRALNEKIALEFRHRIDQMRVEFCPPRW